MDAYFRHRDGSVLGGWNQPHRIARDAADQLLVHRHEVPVDEPVTDPPYTPQFGDLVAAFPSSDFLYDSETEIERHHFEYRADGVIARNQTVTAAFAYDGERGVLTNHRSTAAPQRPERNNTGTTVQYEATGERVSLVGGIRFENNGSFGFYAAPSVAVSWLVSQGAGSNAELGATRLRASVGRGIKEPLFIQSYSPSPSFLGNPDLAPERSRGFDVGIEQRFAGDRAAIEATYFANHFDDLISLGPFDPVTFNAQYENIGETRASGLELAGTAILERRASRRRRLHAARFKGDSQHQQQPDFRARQAAVPASSPLGIDASVLHARSSQRGAGRRVRRIAASTATSTSRRSRRTTVMPRGMRAAKCASRGGPPRSSPSTTSPTTTTWSRWAIPGSAAPHG